MIQNVIQTIGGVGIYGVISICLFFSVFMIALVWTCVQKAELMQALSTVPLDDERPACGRPATGVPGASAIPTSNR